MIVNYVSCNGLINASVIEPNAFHSISVNYQPRIVYYFSLLMVKLVGDDLTSNLALNHLLIDQGYHDVKLPISYHADICTHISIDSYVTCFLYISLATSCGITT